MGERKLGTTTLRKYEQEREVPGYRDVEAIARACGVSVHWFTADYSRLGEIAPPDSRRVIAMQTAAAVERARERRAGKHEDTRPPRAADQ